MQLTILLSSLWLSFHGTFVSCQYITISAPATVNYKIDKLKFTCSPTNVQSTSGITSISLAKNTSAGYSDIVRVFIYISTGQVVNKVQWFQTAVQNRATVITSLVYPTSQARLEFDVNATEVLCSDEGTYRCSIHGTTSGGQSITGSAVTSVSMKVEATSVNQIQTIPFQPEGVYNPNTEVQLSCTGTVGNPPKDLRWCYRRSSIDNTFLGLTANIGTANQGTAFPRDCQYIRTSILVYNVSSDFDEIEFRCETRYDDFTVCGHSSVIAANYTIKRFIVPTNPPGSKCEGDLITCQYITISAQATINYQVDKLKFICSPTDVQSTSTITSIALAKNTSAGYSDIVRVYVDISNGQIVNKVLWYQNAIQNRATVITASVTPTNHARLEFYINPEQVLCSDEGTYQCSIIGTTSGGQSITGTAVTSVSMKVAATSINQIQAIPFQPEGVYNPNTEVQLSCTGTVGNPPKDLRWCYRRLGIDNSFLGLTTNIGTANQGTAFPQDCQYSRTSVLVYNVSSNFDEIEFRCETRYGDCTVCGHSSVIGANYTINRFTVPTNPPGSNGKVTDSTNILTQACGDKSYGGVIAGAVLGSYVGGVLTVLIVYFIVFRKKNEDKNMNQ